MTSHGSHTKDKQEVGKHRPDKGGCYDNIKSPLESGNGKDDLNNVAKGGVEQTSDDIAKAQSQI